MANRRHLIAGLAAGLLLAGAPAFALDKLPVVASFSVLGDFVKEVGGDRVTVTTLVGPDGDAHVYSPTPADAKSMAGAKLIVVNGMKFEGWITRLATSSGAKATVATATTGITPLKAEGETGKKDAHGHAHTGEADPHAWQSVANAKIYVANIRDALGAADPAGKPVFEANAIAYLAKLEAVESEIKAAVARIPADRRKAITSHDAFGYFVKAYGIAFIAPQGVSTEAEASAKDVARIIRQMKAKKIPAVFLENVTNPRLVEQIAKETGARVGGRLFSDALSDASGPAGTYIAMMKHNISQIEKALGAGPVERRIRRKHHVIPDKPRSGAAPGSIVKQDGALRWIPEFRFAASRMTGEDVFQIAGPAGLQVNQDRPCPRKSPSPCSQAIWAQARPHSSTASSPRTTARNSP